uniref:Cytochrome f n=1 Tax=Apophlaea sinclairii TaxID=212746 RepID=A0A1C9CBH2_9FLOR|nr:cytochrome f [Apophlaea sinclairii]AOM65715.1 cytochrome f [Apophlaea sinclairii]
MNNRNIKFVFSILFSLALLVNITNGGVCYGFPIYAQQSYDNPREATGRIVCANCHLAQKPVKIETPQSVLPNSVFEARVEIPYNNKQRQVLGDGNTGPLNMGAIVILPEGFKLAPKSKVSEAIQTKNKGIYIQPYSKTHKNILVVGPIPSNTHQEITFPIIAPDPAQDKNTHFLKYPIYVGGNRGRGQIYPSGEKSNNNIVVAKASGKVQSIQPLDDNNLQIDIQDIKSNIITYSIPSNIELTISEGDIIDKDQALTTDPNIGGFGQSETEIVLQNPKRIQGMIVFFFIFTLAQIFFVLKKKQFEKVQALEKNF